MVIWRCRVPAISSPLPLGTFVKHIPAPLSPRQHRLPIHSNGVVATKAADSAALQALSHRQREQIDRYVDTLLQWNQKMNLTAVREVDEVMERHIEDSLAIIPPLQSSYIPHGVSHESISVVDVGSGAGLPGLVLAIARPDWQVTLLESMKKRCLFLEHAVSVTGLSNVHVVRGRAEDLGHDPCFREHFDVAVARAVAEMRVLAEYCLPLVRVGGLFIAAKGHDPEEEVKNAETAVQLMGASVLQLCSVESHSPHGQRTAVICIKCGSTPTKYPRLPVDFGAVTHPVAWGKMEPPPSWITTAAYWEQ
ncbi:uncharacterized protein LOC116212902 isoform X2 [Punica granatum]|uniref:Uncharacterized protein LOC116212902 isoform X2 n=1 Tax=Punica granatum TaxID=22663 RepID=A0A6P8EDT3_PUNGR|nr:uncharacterized protein LOC116212902 isoform X2 [Punica granatum]